MSNSERVVNVTTWADGFGVWHARVDEAGNGIGDVASVEAAALDAIRSELAVREGPQFAPEVIGVQQTSRTSYGGILSTEFVETLHPTIYVELTTVAGKAFDLITDNGDFDSARERCEDYPHDLHAAAVGSLRSLRDALAARAPHMLPDGTCRGCGAFTGGRMPCAPDCPLDGELPPDKPRQRVATLRYTADPDLEDKLHGAIAAACETLGIEWAGVIASAPDDEEE